MIEEQLLFEWSPEVALALNMQNSDWVVKEDADEDIVSTVNQDRSQSISMVGMKDVLAQINAEHEDYNLPSKSLAEREADGEDEDLEKDFQVEESKE